MAQKKPKKQKTKPQDKPLEWKSLEKLPTKRQHDAFKNWEASGFDISKLTDSATEAGYPKKYAKELGIKAIIAHANNPAVLEALEKHKITIERTVGKVSRIMDAKHPNQKFGYNDEDGRWQQAEDYPTQLKATQYAGQLLDIAPSKKVDITEKIHSKQEITITFETSERIKKADAMIEGDIIDAEVI